MEKYGLMIRIIKLRRDLDMSWLEGLVGRYCELWWQCLLGAIKENIGFVALAIVAVILMLFSVVLAYFPQEDS